MKNIENKTMRISLESEEDSDSCAQQNHLSLCLHISQHHCESPYVSNPPTAPQSDFILLSDENEFSTQQVVTGIVDSNCRRFLTLGSCVHALNAAIAVDGLSLAKLLFHLVSHIINSLRRKVGFGRT